MFWHDPDVNNPSYLEFFHGLWWEPLPDFRLVTAPEGCVFHLNKGIETDLEISYPEWSFMPSSMLWGTQIPWHNFSETYFGDEKGHTEPLEYIDADEMEWMWDNLNDGFDEFLGIDTNFQGAREEVSWTFRLFCNGRNLS
eukprot:UN04672